MIYLIITTTINNKFGNSDYEHRKNRYLDSIKNAILLLMDYNIKIIIVENGNNNNTYLDNLGCDVVYTNNNNQVFKHKGQNELMDIKSVIDKYNIQDDDIIIKLTGRYKLLNTHFIDNIILNKDNYDAFIKFFNVCSLQYHNNLDDCVLGLFAVKCKFIKKFRYSFISSPEVEFANFIKENVDLTRINNIKNLNLECCFADNLRLLIV